MTWIKPKWSNQIPDGDYEIRVGDSDGFIRCDSYLEYFLGEGTYQVARKLNNTKTIELNVFTLDENALDRIDKSRRPHIFGDIAATANEPFILDIDLDFFSTDNPFKAMYAACGTYELLKPIFRGDFFEQSFDGSSTEDELLAFTAKRSHYIDCLEKVFQQLEENVDVAVITFAECLHPVKEKVLALIGHIQKANGSSNISWKTYFDAGCTLDSNELPAYISTLEQIAELIILFKQFLLQLADLPSLITISRSSDDDYCPPDQVDHIQKEVLKVIADVYGDKVSEKPILHYNDDQWAL